MSHNGLKIEKISLKKLELPFSWAIALIWALEFLNVELVAQCLVANPTCFGFNRFQIAKIE